MLRGALVLQVVLFNALSSEPEDDRCIRLTGVAGGLQVMRSMHALLGSMQGSRYTQGLTFPCLSCDAEFFCFWSP